MSQNRIVRAIGCAIALSTIASAEPSAAQAKPPAAVAADLKSNEDLCREVGGKPDATRAVKSADLSGDGKPDFVLYVGWFACDGAWSVYGDREKGVTVYAGDGSGGAVAAFRDAVFQTKLEGTGAAAKLWLTVSGGGCGKPPAPDFAHENFCERALVWNAKTRKFDYAPVSTVRMIE
jgi:hypothetical protein